jgi:hypothetical protein
MPVGSVVGRIAVAIFVEQWCIVEIRVGGNGQCQDAEPFANPTAAGSSLVGQT